MHTFSQAQLLDLLLLLFFFYGKLLVRDTELTKPIYVITGHNFAVTEQNRKEIQCPQCWSSSVEDERRLYDEANLADEACQLTLVTDVVT